MITVKKSGREFKIPNDDFMAIQDTSDGMYFRFKDGDELRIMCEVTAEVKAVPQMVMNSTAKDIVIDFQSKNLISIAG